MVNIRRAVAYLYLYFEAGLSHKLSRYYEFFACMVFVSKPSLVEGGRKTLIIYAGVPNGFQAA